MKLELTSHFYAIDIYMRTSGRSFFLTNTYWVIPQLKRKAFPKQCNFLTLSRRTLLSYRNQSIDLLRKSMDWFLYDNGLRLQKVKLLFNLAFTLTIKLNNIYERLKPHLECYYCIISLRISINLKKSFICQDKKIIPEKLQSYLPKHCF